MRFLLFNMVVLGALGYLFVADEKSIQETTEQAQEAIMSVRELANAAMDKVMERDGTKPAPAKPAPAKPAPAKPATPAAPEAVAEKPAPAADAPAPKPEPKPARTRVAAKAPAIEEVEVAERVARPVPGQKPLADMARAEPAPKVLASANVPPRPAPSAAVPAKPEPQGKVAIAEGESLMSSGERLRELHSLAQEMEMMFVHRVGK